MNNPTSRPGEASDEEVTDGSTRAEAVRDKRDARRDDDTESASHCYHGCNKIFIITKLCQQRDTHGADRSHSGWAGNRRCTIEQARDNNCDWKTRWEIAEEIGKDIEQATGQSAFRHNAGMRA